MDVCVGCSVRYSGGADRAKSDSMPRVERRSAMVRNGFERVYSKLDITDYDHNSLWGP